MSCHLALFSLSMPLVLLPLVLLPAPGVWTSWGKSWTRAAWFQLLIPRASFYLFSFDPWTHFYVLILNLSWPTQFLAFVPTCSLLACDLVSHFPEEMELVMESTFSSWSQPFSESLLWFCFLWISEKKLCLTFRINISTELSSFTPWPPLLCHLQLLSFHPVFPSSSALLNIIPFAFIIIFFCHTGPILLVFLPH